MVKKETAKKDEKRQAKDTVSNSANSARMTATGHYSFSISSAE
jgi:hypothetical protein